MPPKSKAKGKAKAAAAEKPDTNTFDVDKMLSYLSKPEQERLQSDAFLKEADQAFDEADVNGNGTIDGPEIPKAVFKVVGPHRAAFLQITPANAEELLLKFDADKSGTIEKNEFHNFVKWLIAKEMVDYFSGATHARQEEGLAKLDGIMDELIKCYDMSGNDSIERVDFLDAEEKIEAFIVGVDRTDLSVKDRKLLMAWFKDSGAEGSPSDGMYLPYDKFKQNFPKRLAARLQRSEQLDERVLALDPETHASQFADFLQVRILDPFMKLRFPKAAAGVTVGEDGKPNLPPPPTYPITISLKEMQNSIEEAIMHRLNILIVHGDNMNAETFLSYQSLKCFECKAAILELGQKKKTKDDLKKDLRAALIEATKGKSEMEALSNPGRGCFPKPLWFRLANSAFDFSELVDNESGLPSKVFEQGWSVDDAFAAKFIDAGEKNELEATGNLKNFYLLFTSACNLDFVNNHLKDKIPNLDKFAIIVIKAD